VTTTPDGDSFLDAPVAGVGDVGCTVTAIFGACASIAVAHVLARCPHGHVRDGFQCETHADDPDRGLCGTCWESDRTESELADISTDELPGASTVRANTKLRHLVSQLGQQIDVATDVLAEALGRPFDDEYGSYDVGGEDVAALARAAAARIGTL
jgi:hypothetical protein